MNQQTKTWQPKRLLIFFSVLLSVIIIDACRKIDRELEKPKDANDPVVMADKFFTIPAGTHPKVKAIAASMQKQNATLKFTEPLIKNAGYPLWDKAKVYTRQDALRTEGEEEPEDTTIVYVPFSLANSTSAIMTIAINLFSDRDTAYNMLYPQQYKQYGFDTTLPRATWNARNLFALFFEFETDIYGTDSMYVFDGRIFGHDEEDSLVIKRQQVGWGGGEGRVRTEYWESNCEVFLVGGPCPPSEGRMVTDINPVQGPCLLGDITICNSVWVDQGPSSGSWNPGDANPFAYPTGSGGGGSSTGLEDLPDVPMCPVAARMTTDAQGGILINPCGPPWIPALPPEVYNPFLYDDSIIISSALESVYPCAFDFINDSLPNANFFAQLAGSEVFKDSTFMHLRFDTSTTYTQAGQPAGVTVNGSAQVHEDGVTHYTATIKLNGWYLRNATKEYMISTILHEIMHATFNLRWGQYQQWLTYGPPNDIDSAWMKAHYPYFWQNFVVNGIPSGTEAGHEVMASDYYEMFSNTLKYYYNSNAPQAIKDSVIKALCFGGLHNTTAWKNLPAKGIDTCYYKGIQVAAENSATGNMMPQGCSSTYSYHYNTDCKMRPSCN